MPNHSEIYASKAEQYELLISHQPSLLQVIEAIKSPVGLDIVDIGAGTGRLACTLAPMAKSVLALDASEAMLHIAASRLEQAGCRNWSIRVADHRSLPAEDRSADLIVSGWSVCYLGSDDVEGWEANIGQVIGEIRRILRPGGTAILFENGGTGSETPNPPDFLKPYFGLLERQYGFTCTWIRTDYRFDNRKQAERLTRFFFGDSIADKVAREQLTHVPECAAVFTLHL
ncbi:class I SAM-dependent methyltransferase [Paenibacillus piri]|uniref:Class I SAM-dependent methyltransferase n=1 Tax=Paenibacillus piri TaxID=2547395 RepID=A0A4R5KDT2_9BACL|nr:class I SAM-dependent methyltransferase [Paenibacillus piri]TDF92357.1 class I SAM-dependent methyltransferase [Paenibacillus piri]